MADLFPAPSPPPSPLSPQRLPGANAESLAALRRVLADNHERYHLYRNDKGFHNHTPHRALAIYALGGSASLIRDYYERDSRIQRPAFESPEPITEHNFLDHLGDDRFYQSYISFFANKVSEIGATSTLEEYVFSERCNFQHGRAPSAQPEMLGRLLSGLVHPFIQTGYGAEFGLKGTLVEGLAQTAVHPPRVLETVSPSFFSPRATEPDEVAVRLSSLTLDAPPPRARNVSKTGGVHAFDVVARILKDPRYTRKTTTEFANRFAEILLEYSSIIRDHAEKWTVDLDEPGEVERKMEELLWLSTVLYAAGGLTRDDGFRADFYLMHMVTSSLFLPSLIAYLSPRSQVLLMRAYLFQVLAWWLTRGGPVPNIKSFMTTTSLEPSVPTTPASPPRTPSSHSSLSSQTSPETTPTPNAFLPVLQSAMAHPNDHVVKIQRTFAHLDVLYGTRPRGYFSGTELAEAETLDGSAFLRAALATADYVGWVREGGKERGWSNDLF